MERDTDQSGYVQSHLQGNIKLNPICNNTASLLLYSYVPFHNLPHSG